MAGRSGSPCDTGLAARVSRCGLIKGGVHRGDTGSFLLESVAARPKGGNPAASKRIAPYEHSGSWGVHDDFWREGMRLLTELLTELEADALAGVQRSRDPARSHMAHAESRRGAAGGLSVGPSQQPASQGRSRTARSLEGICPSSIARREWRQGPRGTLTRGRPAQDCPMAARAARWSALGHPPASTVGIALVGRLFGFWQAGLPVVDADQIGAPVGPPSPASPRSSSRVGPAVAVTTCSSGEGWIRGNR